MNILEAQQLSKKFKEKIVVDDIDLIVKQGQLVAFLGPNGAGKSTTFNMLIGALAPSSGTITIKGKLPSEASYKQRIGVVFQQSVLDDRLTVKQNLTYRTNMYKNASFSVTDPIIERLGISSLFNQSYQSLSGGQRRRVDIARALLHQPELLLLDEPSTGLDIQTRTTIWQFLNELRQERKLTIILTTHYLEEAETADFIYIIDQGKIIAADTMQQLKKQHAQNVLTLYTTMPQNILSLVKASWTTTSEKGQLRITIPDISEVLPFLNLVNQWISHFEFRKGTMDDIFLSLTGKEIR